MKIYFYCIALLFLIQCKTISLNKRIQYVVPFQVESRLLKQMQVSEQLFTFFSLRKSKENYVITMIQGNKEELARIDKFNMLSKTTRYLLINQKFYPILFDTDYQFGTFLKKNAIRAGTEERWTNESFGIPRSHPIYEGSFSLTFSNKGEILSP